MACFHSLFLLVFAILAAFSIGWHTLGLSDWQMLDPAKLIDLAQTGAILDQNGQLVTTLVGKENRT
ncbi:MAG: hypothetical protein MJ119_06885, partial [Lachnospiraceae bacterium]|nr:hypothetical protein [Lachnospiraceae bacterium]